MELFRALASLSEPPTASHGRITEVLGLPPLPHEAASTDLFVMQLPPYASMYLGSEGMLGGDVRDRIAGFFAALHMSVPHEPDHLAVLLATYAAIADREAAEAEPAHALLWREARKALPGSTWCRGCPAIWSSFSRSQATPIRRGARCWPTRS